MRVTFTKKHGHYAVYVSRDRATDLFIRSAPGYDDWLPHDLLHFVAEAEYDLGGVLLATQLERGWRKRTLEPKLLARLDALAEQWHSLPVGGELTVEWPRPEGVRRRDRQARTRHKTAGRQTVRA